jgi:hypothetical protein
MHEYAGQEAPQRRIRLDRWRYSQVDVMDYDVCWHGFLPWSEHTSSKRSEHTHP